ncbi:YflT domain-containing protein [Rugosimonospora acidiphila]
MPSGGPMSTFANLTSRLPSGPGGVPSIPANGVPPAGPTTQVASFDDYPSAQRSVDFLSDNGFPVEQSTIVGTDLRLVENVLGRLTTGRAALAGAASGAWFGVLIGLLLGIFTVSSWWQVLVAAIVIATAWGAIFGAIAHAATGGRRDFSSRTSLLAEHYAVNVGADHAEAARQLLTRLNWQSTMTPDGGSMGPPDGGSTPDGEQRA